MIIPKIYKVQYERKFYTLKIVIIFSLFKRFQGIREWKILMKYIIRNER